MSRIVACLSGDPFSEKVLPLMLEDLEKTAPALTKRYKREVREQVVRDFKNLRRERDFYYERCSELETKIEGLKKK